MLKKRKEHPLPICVRRVHAENADGVNREILCDRGNRTLYLSGITSSDLLKGQEAAATPICS